MKPVLLVATTNRHKIAEMEPILAPALDALGVELRPLGEEQAAERASRRFVEDRATFAGNATVKALGAADVAGLVSLAEDSGLEVEALSGAPGVRSARFSGAGWARNNRLLLEKLAGVPAAGRGARFRAVVAIKVPGGPLYVAEGTTDGSILDDPRGDRGFGYDPVFLSTELGRAFGEVPAEEKRKVSHRSRALRAIRGYLFEIFADRTPRGVPTHRWCLDVLREAGCPEGLVEHQVAVGRLCRETALLLRENGYPVDPALAAAAGLLHDIGKTWRDAACRGASRRDASRRDAGGDNRCPAGVAHHAWLSAAWAAERGLDPRLARAALVHGLDSLISDEYCPRSWEERILMLCDKLAEREYLGLKRRLAGLRQRRPAIRQLTDKTEPLLYGLEADLAQVSGMPLERFRRDLKACLGVAVFGPEAGPGEVEKAWASRSRATRRPPHPAPALP